MLVFVRRRRRRCCRLLPLCLTRCFHIPFWYIRKRKNYNSFMFYGKSRKHTQRQVYTRFTIEKNPRMQFHFVSYHILCLFTWLFISFSSSFFLLICLYFFSTNFRFFPEILVYLANWIRVYLYGNAICYLQVKLSHTSHFVEISVVHVERAYILYAACNNKSKRILLVIPNGRNYHFYVLHANFCFLFCGFCNAVKNNKWICFLNMIRSITRGYFYSEVNCESTFRA